jgi:hypothetical protein
MTKKMLTVGAIGLLLALGCDDEPEETNYQQQEEITPDPNAMEQTETERGEQAQRSEEPFAAEELQQEPGVFGEPEVGQQQEGMELTQGQPMSRRSGNDFDRTLRTLRRELQNADFVVAGIVPLQREQQQQGQQQQQAGEAKPDGREMRAELLLFANRNALGDVQGDPLIVLGGPTAILVYEDDLTGDVLIGFEDPELAHIVDASIGAGQPQQGTTQPQQGTTQPPGQQPEGMEAERDELPY